MTGMSDFGDDGSEDLDLSSLKGTLPLFLTNDHLLPPFRCPFDIISMSFLCPL